MFSLQSVNKVIEVLSLGTNASPQPCTPLIDCLVNDALFRFYQTDMRHWFRSSMFRCFASMSDRCVLVSNHRYCSQPDWGLVILLTKVLVQSILQSPDVAMQQCPEPDVLERCPAGRRRSFLTCVWSLAEPSASAGHPGSMHHLPLLRVQQRTVCAAQLRDCCGYHDWRSGRSAAGARYQHYASLLTKIRYSEHW